MAKTSVAKYAITNLLASAPRGRWFSNAQLLNRVSMNIPVSLKTVQNVTAGLKSFGGLRSTRSGSITKYTRISKSAVANASTFVF